MGRRFNTFYSSRLAGSALRAFVPGSLCTIPSSDVNGKLTVLSRAIGFHSHGSATNRPRRPVPSNYGFFLDDPYWRSRSLPHADAIAWECGTDSEDPFGLDRQWRHLQFQRYPLPLATRLAKQYKAIYEADGRAMAAIFLWQVRERLEDVSLDIIVSDEAIGRFADRTAARCSVALVGLPDSVAVERAGHLMTYRGVAIPEVQSATGLI